MKPYLANLMNALVLVAVGGWGYMDKGATTALIPVFGGLTLWILTNGVKALSPISSHIAVLVTALVFLGLFKPFFREMNMDDAMGTMRTGLMILSSGFALWAFVQHFIAAKKAKTE